jgi:hypothetical protein
MILWFVGLGIQTQAKAEIFSFTYSDLDGDFEATGPDTGLFTAVAQAAVFLAPTQGDVTRLVPTTGSVTFDFSDPAIGAAGFDLSVTTTAINGNTAIATGFLTITDIDGDTITSMIDGQWIRVGASANLIALLTDVELDNTSNDATFDGTDGAPWSMNFAVPEPYEGNIITLAFQDWFTDLAGTVKDFNNSTTLASGVVTGNTDPPVPEPATFLFLAITAIPVIRKTRTVKI